MGFFNHFRSKTKEPPKTRLTVYSTVEELPWPLQIAHPSGLWDALPGEPKAVKPRRDPRQMLEHSMEDGDYLFEGPLATISARVQKRQKGDAYPGQNPMSGTPPVMGAMERELLENALWVVDLEVTEVVADVKAALDYQADVADRVALLSDGVVLDHQAWRYHLPGSRRLSRAV